MKTTKQNKARAMLVDIIRSPFAWPGGYSKLIVTEDGGLLCHACCRKEAQRIMGDIRDGYNTGWYPAGMAYEAVSPECCSEDCISYCDHCGERFGELC